MEHNRKSMLWGHKSESRIASYGRMAVRHLAGYFQLPETSGRTIGCLSLFLFAPCLLTSCGHKAEKIQVTPAVRATPSADWGVPDRYRGRVVGSGKRAIPQKAVALTFDDGPSANITPQILETLRQHHAVATFFVMGQQVKQYPKLLQQEVAQENAIGYHTYTHALHPSLSQAEREMEQTRQIVQQTIERDTLLFRPPYGNTRSNYTRIARDQHYALILWNVSSADTATHDSDVVLDNCTANVHSGDIILMHDSSTKSHTARALPRILTRLEQQGFTFVTIPDLLRQSAAVVSPPPDRQEPAPKRRSHSAP